MIPMAFKEPNFKCSLTDEQDRAVEWLMVADSEDELRQRVEKLIENTDYTLVGIDNFDFNMWEEKAKAATQKVVDEFERGEKTEFKSTVWSQLKGHLFELFHGKCAYCESRTFHVASGDVEHYRPKKKVEEDTTHPGYYWLAYDKKNLLPSCELCNRARGKMNHFPVRDFRAHRPEELDDEEPLLLHPYNHNPAEHLKFIPGKDGTHYGTVEGITEIGKKSVEVYNLNRLKLVEERRREQEHVSRDVGYYAFSNRAKFREIITQIHTGVRQYSLAALQQLVALQEEFTADVEGGD